MLKRRTLLKAGGAVGTVGAVGLGAAHFRTRLYDVRLDNERSERVSVEIRLDADGERAVDATFDLRPHEQIHLPCEWPRAAWSYRMAARPEGASEWRTITWDDGGKHCKKVQINAEDERFGPVSFYYSADCPWRFEENSCGPAERSD